MRSVVDRLVDGGPEVVPHRQPLVTCVRPLHEHDRRQVLGGVVVPGGAVETGPSVTADRGPEVRTPGPDRHSETPADGVEVARPEPGGCLLRGGQARCAPRRAGRGRPPCPGRSRTRRGARATLAAEPAASARNHQQPRVSSPARPVWQITRDVAIARSVRRGGEEQYRSAQVLPAMERFQGERDDPHRGESDLT